MNKTTQQVLDSRLGAELSDEEAGTLAGLMKLKELHGAEYLISEGVVDNSLHLVIDGNIEVVKRRGNDGIASIAIIREGDLAGELSFIDGEVHTVGLRALNDGQVLSLTRENFEKLIDKNPQLVYKVMRAVARSAHRIVHQMNHEFIELNNYIFKQHGRY